MVSYSWTDETTNDADFRYIQTSPTLTDTASDLTSTNYESFAMVNPIDARVCGTDPDYVMVALVPELYLRPLAELIPTEWLSMGMLKDSKTEHQHLINR